MRLLQGNLVKFKVSSRRRNSSLLGNEKYYASWIQMPLSWDVPDLILEDCVGQAIVQGDEIPVSDRHKCSNSWTHAKKKKVKWNKKWKIRRMRTCTDGMKSENASNNCRLRAMCSMLHGELVCVRHVVHVIIHIALNVVENDKNLLAVVHNVPWLSVTCVSS